MYGTVQWKAYAARSLIEIAGQAGQDAEVRIYKRRQEKKKKELDQESDQVKKNSTKKATK